MIENGPDMVISLPNPASLLWTLTAWIADPAVLTAIASLLTALAAFFRARRRGSAATDAASDAPCDDAGLSRAYQQLHDVEDRIREELLLQLQNLQEEAELIGLDLADHRRDNATLKAMILRCPSSDCPARYSLSVES